MLRIMNPHTSLSRLNLNDWMDDFFSPVNGFKMDVLKEETHYLIHAELPGIKKENITISYEDGRLTIEVNHEQTTEKDTKEYLHKERRHVNMKRSITLTDIDDKNIKAWLEDGVLSIHVPKMAPVDTRILIDVE